MVIQMGETYSFNNAIAVVLLLEGDQVIWRGRKAKRTTYTTPLWYFEKYAVPYEEATPTLTNGNG